MEGRVDREMDPGCWLIPDNYHTIAGATWLSEAMGGNGRWNGGLRHASVPPICSWIDLSAETLMRSVGWAVRIYGNHHGPSCRYCMVAEGSYRAGSVISTLEGVRLCKGGTSVTTMAEIPHKIGFRYIKFNLRI
jgi:hypothetical protein